MEQVKRGRGRPPKANPGERKTCGFRFFRIILPSVLDHNSLGIPEKFSRNFSSEHSVAKLSVPTGLFWKVAISRGNTKLYFTQGWKEFMHHNDIRFGYFLEFEYRGNCNFRVRIFDLSCCEIDYPSSIPSCPAQSDNVIQCPTKKEPMQVKEEEDEEKMFEANCGNPSFTITMRKSHCSKNELFVPKRYMRNFMLRKFVKLRGNDGREWRLRCNYYKCCMRLSGSDWTKFRKENNLELGDKCTFLLVSENLHSFTLEATKE